MAGKWGRVMLGEGAKAPSALLTDLEGNNVPLRQLTSGGPVLLVFFKISCPVCQFALPYLERIRENTDIRIYGVSQNNAEDTRQFLKSYRIHFPVLLDEAARGYPASNGFGISQVPSQFQLAPDGAITHAWEGWSKADMESLGERAGMSVLRSGEIVPAMRPG
ncbi:MAG: TlpA family protein disulfide reductase [Bryobacterales bacterium]|nr:TlpA family protein disulfide reductase [Bryobacterales bacterium]